MYDPLYCQRLSSILVENSINDLFYSGNISEGSMIITKEVVNSLKSDRASIWLYNQEESAILCDRIYIRSTGKFHDGMELHEKDYPEYFEHLKRDEAIVADFAETHPATSCFLETYLNPLEIKSMLDVPIWHKHKIIGVFCIENCTRRKWLPEEVYFAQMLSSLYSFSYSVKENRALIANLREMDDFINSATLVSKTDKNGKITYVNKKFQEITGWGSDDIIGRDHNILNSGIHPRSFWKDMYKTVVVDKKIWNSVITNRNKSGQLFYVDTFIKADFDEDGEVREFYSIRQDVSKIIESMNEIDKKNSYLEHAAKIIRHDMHSGINTYIPRGISSLERRIPKDLIKKYKLEIPLRLLKEGLIHTQKIYKGVYEFTNLVKKDSLMETEELNLKKILSDFLKSTSYTDSVIIDDLGFAKVNESLFCTALDNLIRNGLKYNDSPTKWVKIYRINNTLNIEDNGRGMDRREFTNFSEAYIRGKNKGESGSGLGLNICIAILKQHGFPIDCRRKRSGGTVISIEIK